MSYIIDQEIEQLQKELQKEELLNSVLVLRKKNAESFSEINSLTSKVLPNSNLTAQVELQFSENTANTKNIPTFTCFSQWKNDPDINIANFTFSATLARMLESQGLPVNLTGRSYMTTASREDVIQVVNNFTKFPFSVKYVPNGYFSTDQICSWINLSARKNPIKAVYSNFDSIHKVFCNRAPYFKIDKADFLKRRKLLTATNDYKRNDNNNAIDAYCATLGEDWHRVSFIRNSLNINYNKVRKFMAWLNLSDELITFYKGKSLGIISNTKFYKLKKSLIKPLYHQYTQGNTRPNFSVASAQDVLADTYVWLDQDDQVINGILDKDQLDPDNNLTLDCYVTIGNVSYPIKALSHHCQDDLLSAFAQNS